MINLLSKIVAIDSRYPNEGNLGAFLETYLKEIGFRTERVYISQNRFNILATRGSSDNKILFYGHQDTVDITDINRWTSSPFKLLRKGDRLYGLGAYDMKGGITAFLDALKRSSAPAKVMLAVDEENISEGAWRVVKLHRNFFADVSLIISAEPNFNTGLHSIVNGRVGRYIFEATVRGKPVHIAEYKSGLDAIEVANKFLSEFYISREKIFRKTGSLVQVRKIVSESVGMSVPGIAQMEIEVLSGPLLTHVDLLNNLPKIKGVTVVLKKRKTPYLSGYLFKSFPHKADIANIIKKVTGNEMELLSRNSVGDDNVLAQLKIPVITWGPNGGNAHSPNEYVSKRGLTKLNEMYFKLLENIG